ncbi:MAG: S1 RNA-binding domain-containing protein [Planctomycetes bacterium]|nr:S1 RNA-binding domain-containing protein [Planctomycetota bacterium]
MPEKALKSVASQYHLTVEQVQRILELLESGCSIPYILRYHKELAANLKAEDFYDLLEEKERLDKLARRRVKIVKKLQDRGALPEGLEEQIQQAGTIHELVDYYVPYRPRKRSRSRLALAQGLEPLATKLFAQQEFIPDLAAEAEPYVGTAEGLADVESVLEGAFCVVSDWIAEEKTNRGRQREVLKKYGEIVSHRRKRSLPGRLVHQFRSYFDFRERVGELHPYHMLMILRGKRSKVLDYSVLPPLEQMQKAAAELYLPGGAAQFSRTTSELGDAALTNQGKDLKNLNSTEFMVACIKHSIENTLARVLVREVERGFSQKAADYALDSIRRNVKSRLMVRPLPRRTLGIHPGYRTGCNVAALDEQGNVLQTTTIYPHAPRDEREEATETLVRMIEEHKLEVAAIGQGAAVEETEDLLSDIIKDRFNDLSYAVICEDGLKEYSRSRSAQNELSDMTRSERVAVAVGRRLIDPLSELIKVKPSDLCPPSYVDDVDSEMLRVLLHRVIEECVCSVGVDLNNVQQNMLCYISGLDPEQALQIVSERENKGPFKSRRQLRDVPKVDEESYRQAVGFVRAPASSNPLDVTRIHPNLYPVAEAICEQLDLSIEDMTTEEGKKKLQEHRAEIRLADLEKQFDVHYLLLKDVVDEMIHPWPDPRLEEPAPVLLKKRLTLAELEPDQWLQGTVRNIVEFGVFVDVGVGEDGLIHISELADGFVETPYDVVCVGDSIRARVVRVDEEKSRIALSLRKKGAPKKEVEPPKQKHRERASSRREPSQKVARAPDRKPGAAAASVVRTPKSTVGWDSRRVQKAAMASRLSKAQQRILQGRDSKSPNLTKAQENAAEKPGGKEGKKMGGLLDGLDFANIEKRGQRGG